MLHRPLAVPSREYVPLNVGETARAREHWDHSAVAAESRLGGGNEAGKAGFVSASPLDILRSTFGFQDFRGVQDQVIGRVMAGRHTLAVMPTGAGKSLCYQVPALARPGTALVISPLIALMHDQIRAAEGFGLRAAALTSADSNREETVARLKRGELDLLYVAPERATGEAFRSLIGRVPLALVAID